MILHSISLPQYICQETAVHQNAHYKPMQYECLKKCLESRKAVQPFKTIRNICFKEFCFSVCRAHFPLYTFGISFIKSKWLAARQIWSKHWLFRYVYTLGCPEFQQCSPIFPATYTVLGIYLNSHQKKFR